MISKLDFEREVEFKLNDDFKVVVNLNVEYKRHAEAFLLNDDSTKIVKYRLLGLPGVFSTLKKVVDKDGDLVVRGDEVEYFAEALNCFVHNWLKKDEDKEVIGRKYKEDEEDEESEEGGFSAKIMEKNKDITLGVFVGEKIYYLSKYDCRVITASLQKIQKRCGIAELRADKKVFVS